MSLRPRTKAEARRSRYKVAVDADEGRRRREEITVEIRKSNREERLMKKRKEVLQQPHQKVESLSMIFAAAWSNDVSLQLEATTLLRMCISMESTPPIEKVIESGLVPRFVEFLMREDVPRLQLEAGWALTNIIASGTSETTKVVVDHGAIPAFVNLLRSPNHGVCEQAVWALGNIAGDSPNCRDLVLGYGGMSPLLKLLNENSELSMLRIATWTLSNLCRGNPHPPFEQVRPILPILQILMRSNDEDILIDACWTLSYLTAGSSPEIQVVLDADLCQRLISLLHHPQSPSVLLPALRAVGNIVSGDNYQTQYIIEHGALPCLLSMLTHDHKKIIKEACRTISNLTAGNKNHIQAVIDSGLIAPLVHLLQKADFKIKREAACAICNATGGTKDQIKYLMSQNCIGPLCDILDCLDPRIVNLCLQGLENILKVGEAEKEITGGVNNVAQLITDCEGMDKIEALQNHANIEIYEKSVKILETYWLDDELEDDDQPVFVDDEALCFDFSNIPRIG